ncbi:tetratricopeptide repeat (TPR)-like superfamily protein [Carex rostrata]
MVMASFFSPSLSFSLHHFPQPKSTNLSPRSNQPAFLRVSIRHQFNSNLHKISCTKTPQFFLQSIAKGSALFLVGSYLFLGQFHFKPVLAIVTPQSSNISSPLEEKSNTRKEKEENEKKNKTKNNKYDEVLEMYERFLDKNPMDVRALKIVLYGKLRKGKMEEALEYIKRLEILEPGDVEWRLLEAVAYERMGKLSKAKKVYREILDETPLFTKALHGLAMVMHKNHEGPASIQMLNEALELACRENRVTEERNIKILIAMMHIVKGDLDGALKKFEDMTNEDLKDFRPYLCKGILYSLLDKKKEADEQLQIYKSLVPDEFPQRGFLEDCIRTAKTDSHDRLHKDFFL